jgi:integrase
VAGINLLSASRVATEIKRKVKQPGMWHDGGGLYLQVARNGSVSWILRYKSPTTGKTRDMGLGSAHNLGLEDARNEAEKQRKIVHKDKLDPIEERGKASKNGVTFGKHFEYMERHAKLEGWRRQLELHAFETIGDKVVTTITTRDCVEIIGKAFHAGQFETARRLQQRIQAVLQSATGKIETVAHKKYICLTLRAFKKVRKNKPYKSVDFDKVPALVRELHERPEIAALALEWVILTVCRTGDIIGPRAKRPTPKPPLRWSDIDQRRRVWIVPAVKTADDTNPEPFEIPLSDAAMDVLDRMKAMKLGSEIVFPRESEPNRHKDMLPYRAMWQLLQDLHGGASVHGMRTAFRTFAGERLKVENDVIETALAHRIFSEDKAEAAYKNKTTYFNKRRAMMQRWGEFVTGKSKVVALKAA